MHKKINCRSENQFLNSIPKPQPLTRKIPTYSTISRVARSFGEHVHLACVPRYY